MAWVLAFAMVMGTMPVGVMGAEVGVEITFVNAPALGMDVPA